jgi:hypothetical protein
VRTDNRNKETSKLRRKIQLPQLHNRQRHRDAADNQPRAVTSCRYDLSSQAQAPAGPVLMRTVDTQQPGFYKLDAMLQDRSNEYLCNISLAVALIYQRSWD